MYIAHGHGKEEEMILDAILILLLGAAVSMAAAYVIYARSHR